MKRTTQFVRRIKSLIVCVALLACVAAAPACADTNSPYEIYLYNAQGVPVDVTASYTIANGYVYSDATGNVIGVASYQKGHIFDMSGNDIGLLIPNN